ncbi:MAG: hypothetical protein LBH98_06415 [Chitinispirillales bacterium]|nr:hypothetical protein [Chitinispirillales bacterium]
MAGIIAQIREWEGDPENLQPGTAGYVQIGPNKGTANELWYRNRNGLLTRIASSATEIPEIVSTFASTKEVDGGILLTNLRSVKNFSGGWNGGYKTIIFNPLPEGGGGSGPGMGGAPDTRHENWENMKKYGEGNCQFICPLDTNALLITSNEIGNKKKEYTGVFWITNGNVYKIGGQKSKLSVFAKYEGWLIIRGNAEPSPGPGPYGPGYIAPVAIDYTIYLPVKEKIFEDYHMIGDRFELESESRLTWFPADKDEEEVDPLLNRDLRFIGYIGSDDPGKSHKLSAGDLWCQRDSSNGMPELSGGAYPGSVGVYTGCRVWIPPRTYWSAPLQGPGYFVTEPGRWQEDRTDWFLKNWEIWEAQNGKKYYYHDGKWNVFGCEKESTDSGGGVGLILAANGSHPQNLADGKIRRDFDTLFIGLYSAYDGVTPNGIRYSGETHKGFRIELSLLCFGFPLNDNAARTSTVSVIQYRDNDKYAVFPIEIKAKDPQTIGQGGVEVNGDIKFGDLFLISIPKDQLYLSYVEGNQDLQWALNIWSVRQDKPKISGADQFFAQKYSTSTMRNDNGTGDSPRQGIADFGGMPDSVERMNFLDNLGFKHQTYIGRFNSFTDVTEIPPTDALQMGQGGPAAWGPQKSLSVRLPDGVDYVKISPTDNQNGAGLSKEIFALTCGNGYWPNFSCQGFTFNNTIKIELRTIWTSDSQFNGIKNHVIPEFDESLPASAQPDIVWIKSTESSEEGIYLFSKVSLVELPILTELTRG